jgi:hypothetical protein
MTTSHLSHADGCIRCTCGREWEVSGSALSNPQRLLEWKEGIAAKHVCQPRRPERAKIRVWQAPTTGAQLAHYYSQAMRRMSGAAL